MPIRLAVDLLGSTSEPAQIIEASRLALAAEPDLHLTLVGHPRPLAPLALDPSRVELVECQNAIPLDVDPLVAVRAIRGASVRVVHRMVRDGDVDGCISSAPTEVAIAAAVFVLGQVPGVTRPHLAVLRGSVEHPLVLVDAGQQPDLDVIAQCTTQGAALAIALLGLDAPRVGVLGPMSAEDQATIARTFESADGSFVGSVSGEAITRGGSVDVIVADRRALTLVTESIQGSTRAFAELLTSTVAEQQPPEVAVQITALINQTSAIMSPKASFTALTDGVGAHRLIEGSGFVLGVQGVSVVAPSSASDAATDAIATAILDAVRVVRGGLQVDLTQRMHGLVQRRRSDVGLGSPR